MFRKLLGISLMAVVLVSGAPAAAQVVRLVSSDTDTAKYRVEGAAGEGQEGAVKTAILAALTFATGEVTGDPNEKQSAQEYVRTHIGEVSSFAVPGQIFKRGFDPSGEKMMVGMFVIIDIKGLKAHLAGAGVVTTSRQLSSAVGKPRIMVFYNQGDCARGSESAPACVLPARIREVNVQVQQVEAKMNQFFDRVIQAECLRPTEARMQSSSESDNAGVSASRGYEDESASVGGAAIVTHGGAAGSYHASGHRTSSYAAASAFRSSTSSSASAEFIQASPNCRVFIEQANTIYSEYSRLVEKRDAMQDELDGLRVSLMNNDVTTLRINEWLVRERWEIVDADAVKKAQRTLEAMTSAQGIPTDPVAAVALMAGADVYIVHDYQETNPGGAYQVIVTVKAYDVVTGKQLASSVESSNKLYQVERENAIAAAVGKVMPVVIEQITGYWGDMSAEGVPVKIVLRGTFDNDMIDTLEEVLDEKLADAVGSRNCQGSCSWAGETTTSSTISGVYTLPAEARGKLVRKLRGALRDEGLDFEVVQSSRTLCVIEVR